MRLNLGVLDEYHTPELPIAVMVLLFFLAGYILAYLFNASARFKAKRSIKKLNTTMASHSQEMAGFSISLTKMDSELKKYYDMPADSFGYKRV